MLPSTKRNVSASASSRISWLNPAPHALVVYASPQPSPTDVQHSLPGGRYPLPGRDFHPLEHASFSWRTRFPVPAIIIHGAGHSRGQVWPSAWIPELIRIDTAPGVVWRSAGRFTPPRAVERLAVWRPCTVGESGRDGLQPTRVMSVPPRHRAALLPRRAALDG
jgi:hypothetical protein